MAKIIITIVVIYVCGMGVSTCIGQWLWNIFCECINCKPMTFFQMLAFMVFLSMYVFMFQIKKN